MKKILVVEDDQFLKQLYIDILKQEHYDVESVDDGAKALKVMEKETWDLILLDMILPHMDGYTILTTLIENKKRPACPVVFMTNLDGNDETDKKKLSLADDCWIKSNMSPPEFLEKVKAILK